jgi:UDP-N-acetylmuramate--alanine ligase
MLSHTKKIHFIGIGGVGVSALARMARLKGMRVTGSDISIGKMAERIKNIGGKIFIGHKKENLPKDTDMVIFSPAISEKNPELASAKELNIPIYSYPEALGILSKDMYTIAISGTHGKTTTTCMIAELMIYGNLDPTVVVGGLLKKQQDNFVLGQSKYFVAEACEYKESFLNLNPNILIVLNIDNDHLDYYQNIENIQDAFARLVAKTKNYIICDLNDKNILTAIEKAKNINKLPEIIDYTKEELGIKLLIPGEHNLKNAKAALSVVKLIGLSQKEAERILKNYAGSWRRFEYKGATENGALIYDDYGHHPTEIKATLRGAKEYFPDKHIIVVFQPHLYSRTRILLNDFANSFANVNKVIVTDIYAAREQDDHSIHAKDLVKVINKISNNADYIKNFSEIERYLKLNYGQDTIILTVGAGDIYKIAENLVK